MAPRRDVAPPLTEADAIGRLAERLARIEENIGSVFPGSGEWEFRQVGSGLRAYNRRTGLFGDIVAHVPNVAALPSGADLYRGLRAFVEDTAADLVWYGPVTGWRPPWNMPWGIMGKSTITGALIGVATTTSSLTSLAGTAVAVSGLTGRQVKVTGFISTLSGASGAAGTELYGNLLRDTAGAGNVVVQQGRGAAVAGANVPTIPTVLLDQISGSVTYSLAAHTLAGTANVFAAASQPALVVVEDIGPAAAAPLS